MLTYIDAKHAQLLKRNHLDTFDKVWDYKVNWFEEPNERRGGWSGVGRITLRQDDGSEMAAFLKKQDNHCRTSFLHPVKGVPTFQREFEMMRFLASKNIRTPEVLLFGRNPQGDLKTTLMTRDLAGFESLEAATETMFANGRPDLQKQRALARAVAHFARKLHAAQIQHRSFYPKHLFVNIQNEQNPEVAVIDLEKSRKNRLPFLRTLIDLAVLNRHAKYWSKTTRLYFYLQYFGIQQLTPYTKWLCRLIVKRSNRVKRK